MKIEIKNGRLIYTTTEPAPSRNENASLYIDNGSIASIGTAPEGFIADKVIDAAGKIVCPGLVDLCARLREPGFEYRATLESEMRAAVAGGVTSLVCPPDTDQCSTSPGWSKC